MKKININKNDKLSIKDFEKNIEKYNGKKIPFEQIRKHFSNPDLYINFFNPYGVTEGYVPNEYFYGVYVVDLKSVDKNAKVVLEEGMGAIIDILIFIGTEDSVNVDYSFTLSTPFYDDNKYKEFVTNIFNW